MRANIDHDVCSEMIPAIDVRAGDLVANFGIIDAVLEDREATVLLCCGTAATRLHHLTKVEVFAGLCGDCGETLDDCDNEGGHGA